MSSELCAGLVRDRVAVLGRRLKKSICGVSWNVYDNGGCCGDGGCESAGTAACTKVFCRHLRSPADARRSQACEMVALCERHRFPTHGVAPGGAAAIGVLCGAFQDTLVGTREPNGVVWSVVDEEYGMGLSLVCTPVWLDLR